jgi:hypothetical protein
MTKVRQGQNFIDIVLQATGDFENIVTMAVKNNRCLTDDLEIGEELMVSGRIRQGTVDFFAPLQKRPATAWSGLIAGEPEPNLEGISYWGINVDFVVS